MNISNQIICDICGEKVEFTENPNWQERAETFSGMSEQFKHHLRYTRIPHEKCDIEKRKKIAAEDEAWRKKAAEEEEQRRIETFYSSPYLPRDARTKTFESYRISSENAEVLRILSAWSPADNLGVLIQGPTGTGKTHLLLALLAKTITFLKQIEVERNLTGSKKWKLFKKDMFEKTTRISSYYQELFWVNSQELFSFCQTNRFEEQDTLQLFKETKFLFMDDLCPDSINEYSRDVLYRLIEFRNNNNLQTFISTNASAKELQSGLHERILSRLKSSCLVLELKGTDHRNSIFKQNLARIFARTKSSAQLV